MALMCPLCKSVDRVPLGNFQCRNCGAVSRLKRLAPLWLLLLFVLPVFLGLAVTYFAGLSLVSFETALISFVLWVSIRVIADAALSHLWRQWEQQA